MSSMSATVCLHKTYRCLTLRRKGYRTSAGGGRGRSISTLRTLKPVLLLPRMWRGEPGCLVRGLDGKPAPTRALRGGDGADCSSGGVGGNWLLVLILLGTSLRGAEVGAGAGFPPRGPLFSSSRLTNFLTPGPAIALRFTTGAVAAVSEGLVSEGLSPFWEWNESLRSNSLFEGL